MVICFHCLATMTLFAGKQKDLYFMSHILHDNYNLTIVSH